MAAKQLTDRDRLLLLYLSRCDVLSNEQVARIYGTRKYHYARLDELDSRGLVKRCGSYNEITVAGMREIGSEMRPIKITREWQKEHKVKVSQICLEMGVLHDSPWDYISSRQFKTVKKMNMNAQVDGCLVRDGIEYPVYLLDDEPSKSNLNVISAELGAIFAQFRILRAVVFYPTEKARKLFQEKMTQVKVPQLFFLSYPDEIPLLKYMDEIYRNLASRLKDYKPTGRPFADYEKGRTFVSVMLFNDLVKKKHLFDYMNHVMAKEEREVIILCREEQFGEMESLYPKAKEILKVRKFWGDGNVQNPD
ncbi:MAG: hypothetical protein K6T65_01355 [Peptococcaceae bacterium]|nr:hypothetical protein [Peptococcaceae bacterium]